MDYLVLPGLGSTADPEKALGPTMTRVRRWVTRMRGGCYQSLQGWDEAVTLEEQVALLDAYALRNWPVRPFQVVTSSYGAWPFLLWLSQQEKLPAGYYGATLIDPFISVQPLYRAFPPVLREVFRLTGYWRRGEEGQSGFYIGPRMVCSMLRNDMLRKNRLPLLRQRLGRHIGVDVLLSNNHSQYRPAGVLAQMLEQLQLKPEIPETLAAHWPKDRDFFTALYASS